MQLLVGFLNFIGSLLAFAVQHPITALILGGLTFFLISGLIQGFTTVSSKIWIWILNQLGTVSAWLFQLIWNALQQGFQFIWKVIQQGFQRLWNRRQKA
jgi:hypothetical protein